MFIPLNPSDLFGRKNSSLSLNQDLDVSNAPKEIQSAKVMEYSKFRLSLIDEEDSPGRESPIKTRNL